MAEDAQNPLVTSKPADTPLTVSLHPLVLLTASDLITRHSVRQQKGPLAGVLLGQQNGQETTVEHAFAANLVPNDSGSWKMKEDWTQDRIQQFKDVHKAPALEAVGWFSLCPESGPLPEHAAIQRQFETLFNENAVFLAIHPAAMGISETANRRLPITIYESIAETEEASMQVDGEEHPNLKFRGLPYVVDTDETEMIAIDYVAKGAGSAAAVDGATNQTTSPETKQEAKGKGKADETSPDSKPSSADQSNVLTTEEEDQIAGMTTRLNSVKMLQSRLQTLSTFVQSQPASYISDQTIALTPESPDPTHITHLRSIQALLTRLALLTPASAGVTSHAQTQTHNTLQEATRSQFNDVSLISMLSQLGQDVQGLNELGRKFAQVEQGKSARGKKGPGFGGGGYGGFDEGDGRVGGFTVRDNMLV